EHSPGRRHYAVHPRGRTAHPTRVSGQVIRVPPRRALVPARSRGLSAWRDQMKRTACVVVFLLVCTALSGCRIIPRAITEFPLTGAPLCITAAPDGNLWFTCSDGSNKIRRITPAGVVIWLPLRSAGSGGMTAGRDGTLWFAVPRGNKIGRIAPAGVVTEFPLPGPRSSPNAITLGPDGNLWFTEMVGNRIGRITPAGDIIEFPLPTANSGPNWIAGSSNGSLWFTEPQGNKIGRITPAGALPQFPPPT